MRDRGLHTAEREPIGDDLADIGKLYLAYLGAEVAHRLQSRGHRIDHGLIDTTGVPGVIDADAQTAQAARHAGKIVRHRVQHRGGVVRIAAGDNAEHCAAIGGTARHRADVIERRRQFEHAIAADPAPGRLEPGDAVGRARETGSNRRYRTRASRSKVPRRSRRRTRSTRRPTSAPRSTGSPAPGSAGGARPRRPRSAAACRG